MESMYDRLGELLKESLEEGKIKFSYIAESDETSKSSENTENKNEAPESSESQDKDSSNSNAKESENYSNVKNPVKIKVTPELRNAYRLLDLTFSANEADVKKHYREKLKYYHPDYQKENPVLKKVATKKTEQVVEAYLLIMKEVFLK